MQEWDVVVVIIALAGLIMTMFGPVVRLTRAITRLTGSVENLERNVSTLTSENRETHAKLWAAVKQHGECLSEHGSRLRMIEEEREKRKERANERSID